jgi:hypothetical protein
MFFRGMERAATMQRSTAMSATRTGTILFLFSSFAALRMFSIGEVGSSAEWKDGRALVRAGSHPIMLAWAALGIGLFMFLMKTKTVHVNAGIPSMKRRFGAFLIDFYFSILVIASFGAILPLSLEAVRTGHFTWHFVRDYSVPADAWILPGIVVGMGAMFAYFVLPLAKGKQTVGCFVMRLQILPPFGDAGSFTLREAVRRTYYEFKGLSILRKLDRDSHGRTWYDRETNCTVVLTKYE